MVSPLAFADWAAGTARAGSVLNTDSYNKLAQQSVESRTPVYRLDDPMLFDAIATQQIPPGPGPRPSSEATPPHIGAGHAR